MSHVPMMFHVDTKRATVGGEWKPELDKMMVDGTAFACTVLYGGTVVPSWEQAERASSLGIEASKGKGALAARLTDTYLTARTTVCLMLYTTSFATIVGKMAENVDPKLSASSDAARGLPYYEKLRKDLRETLQKKRTLDKNIVGRPFTLGTQVSLPLD